MAIINLVMGSIVVNGRLVISYRILISLMHQKVESSSN